MRKREDEQGKSTPGEADEESLDSLVEAQLRDLETRKELTNALHFLLESARPRLLRLARLQNVPSDMVEDVVQESLLTAWRSLSHLHQPDRFDAWLDGICRNISRQHRRAHLLQNQQQISISSQERPRGNETDWREDTALLNPDPFDPAEELERQDLHLLLDRALGHLTAGAREAVMLAYLLEMPQREAAARLGLSVRGLEDRLRRARQQLHHILNNELREEAQAFGLTLNSNDMRHWRDSRIWCVLCGRRRLRGLFETFPDGTYGLRMRCEACSLKYRTDILSTQKIRLKRRLRSFHSAYKQIIVAGKAYFARALEYAWYPCQRCGAQAPVQLFQQGERPYPLPDQVWVALPCQACGYTATSSVTSIVCWTDPVVAPIVQRFLAEHPRSFGEPARRATYAGQPAIHLDVLDLNSSAKLTIFVDPELPGLKVRDFFLQP
jgi:RNA polymerase sigma factor (sigma-70 family)